MTYYTIRIDETEVRVERDYAPWVVLPYKDKRTLTAALDLITTYILEDKNDG